MIQRKWVNLTNCQLPTSRLSWGMIYARCTKKNVFLVFFLSIFPSRITPWGGSKSGGGCIANKNWDSLANFYSDFLSRIKWIEGWIFKMIISFFKGLFIIWIFSSEKRWYVRLKSSEDLLNCRSSFAEGAVKELLYNVYIMFTALETRALIFYDETAAEQTKGVLQNPYQMARFYFPRLRPV